jgi:Sec-independent protein translocase protein TatA
MEAAAAEKGLIRINPALVSEIKIDRANSWVVDGQESDELLSHEQGHVDIHLLVEYEKLRELIKLRAKGMRQLKRALLETEHRFQRKLEALNKFYDSPRETDHSRNKQKQSEWEKMIEQHIQAEFAPLANPPAGHKGDEKHSNHKR